MRYEIDIFHYLNIYKKEWKRIFFFIVMAMFIAGAIAYLQPARYRSTVIALSSKESGQAVSFGGILGAANISFQSSSDEIIFSMLKSRRMREDINNHFNLKAKPKFRWDLDTYIVTGGFAIEVTSYDSELTKDIANFAVENVDKINSELQISPNRPLIKVLDPAVRDARPKREFSKKIIASGLFVFLIYTLFIFFKEYFSQLKASKK